MRFARAMSVSADGVEPPGRGNPAEGFGVSPVQLHPDMFLP